MKVKHARMGFPAAPEASFFSACPECGSPHLARTFDETVCNRCGLVLEDNFFA